MKHKTVTEMVRLLRQSGFTQTELAERIGVNQSTISRLESGEMVGVSFEIGMRIYDLYALLEQ
jgi:transcriptional regulator with XRE-family HTH domain